MTSSVDPTLEPLLSPPGSPVSPTPFSFPATQPQTTTLEFPSFSSAPAYQEHQDIPTDKPETTRVLVRNLSKRSKYFYILKSYYEVKLMQR